MNTPDSTSDDEFSSEPPGPDLEAAEYALGVQDAAQRRRSQTRIEADPAFAARVAAWESRLAGLFDGIAPVAPPQHVWPGIRRRLGWPAVEGARGNLWQSVGFWRAAAAAAIVAATALAVLNTVREAPPAVTPASVVRAVTTLSFDDGTPAYLATLDTASGAILLVPVPSAPDAEGRVPELWLIPAGESPRSLGVVTTDKAHTIAVPAELRRAMTAGSTLAISLEPVGGAPQGVPTGPIVAKGNIAST
jgi:anti-sigma-K factor RskA